MQAGITLLARNLLPYRSGAEGARKNNRKEREGGTRGWGVQVRRIEPRVIVIVIIIIFIYIVYIYILL